MPCRKCEPRIRWLTLLIACERPSPEPRRAIPPANPFVPTGRFVAHDRVPGIDRAIGGVATEFGLPEFLVKVRLNQGP